MTGKRIKWKRYIPYYIIFIPALLYLIFNNYMPMFGLAMAFQKVNFRRGILGGQWIGMENFRFLFETKDAWVMTRNTILYNLAFLVLGPSLGIPAAIFMSRIRSKLASRFYQTAILLPYLMSMVVISYFVYAFLNDSFGLVNGVLSQIGIEPVKWYSRADLWPAILIIVSTWNTIGFTSIIYLSTIIGISSDYYEAADLDGASLWRQIIHITLPFLKPTVITLTILGLGRIFRSDFGLFYQVPLNTGALYSTTQTIDTYVFRGLMQIGNLGMSAAAGFYQSMVGFATMLAANFIIKKFSRENALF